MARNKNALTRHFIAELTEGDVALDYKRLAHRITAVNDASDETTEDFAYYDGDGTPTTDVVTVRKAYDVEGQLDLDDPAHLLVYGKEFETGDGRRVMYKQERTDGTVLEGLATISNVVVAGGEASDYAPITFTIGWENKPTITVASTVEQPTG
ncbi:MAG: phage tail protein [Psychrobacillus sp.]